MVKQRICMYASTVPQKGLKRLLSSFAICAPSKKAEETKAHWCEKGGKFLIEESQEPAKEALSCIKKKSANNEIQRKEKPIFFAWPMKWAANKRRNTSTKGWRLNLPSNVLLGVCCSKSYRDPCSKMLGRFSSSWSQLELWIPGTVEN